MMRWDGAGTGQAYHFTQQTVKCRQGESLMTRRVVEECQPYCLRLTLNKLLLNSLGEIKPSQAERVAAFCKWARQVLYITHTHKHTRYCVHLHFATEPSWDSVKLKVFIFNLFRDTHQYKVERTSCQHEKLTLTLYNIILHCYLASFTFPYELPDSFTTIFL